MKAIAYYRVSTREQGRSGLGLEAQKEAITQFNRSGEYDIIGEYIEIESGGKNDRQQLQAALNRCKKEKATLLVAKLDRLSRDVEFIARLNKSSVKFKAADNPYANELMIHIIAAFAMEERKLISKRVTEALAAAKKRGTALGVNSHSNPDPDRLKRANQSRAMERANLLKTSLEAMRNEGKTIREIAVLLGMHNTQVARTMKYLAIP